MALIEFFQGHLFESCIFHRAYSDFFLACIVCIHSVQKFNVKFKIKNGRSYQPYVELAFDTLFRDRAETTLTEIYV